MAITHTFISGKADDADATLVRPSNWNADHTIASPFSVPGPDNFINLAGSPTGDPVTLTATGSDATIPIRLQTKPGSPFDGYVSMPQTEFTLTGYDNGEFEEWGTSSTAVGAVTPWTAHGGMVFVGTATPVDEIDSTFVINGIWNVADEAAAIPNNATLVRIVANNRNSNFGMPANAVLFGVSADYSENIFSVVKGQASSVSGTGSVGINHVQPTATLHIGQDASKSVALLVDAAAGSIQFAGLSTNGFVKTGGGGGTLSVDTDAEFAVGYNDASLSSPDWEAVISGLAEFNIGLIGGGINLGGGILVGGTNTVEQINGVSAQTFSLYHTYTDASNYRRLRFQTGGNFAQFNAEGLGTGATSDLYLNVAGASNNGVIQFRTKDGERWRIESAGHLIGGADNTYDIGASGATRPRTGYFGTSVISPIVKITAPLQAPSSGGAAITGNAVLVGGTVTVSTTKALTASSILLTRKTSGGTIGTSITYTISDAISFTITSDNILDTSTFTWVIVDSY